MKKKSRQNKIIQEDDNIPSYTSDDRQRIVSKIENLKKQSQLNDIMTIIIQNNPMLKYTESNNHVHLNMSELNNETMYLISKYINKLKGDEVDDHYEDYQPYTSDDSSNVSGAKMSIQEKHIVRQKKMRDIIDQHEYQEFDVASLTSDNDVSDSERKKKDNTIISVNDDDYQLFVEESDEEETKKLKI